MPLDGTQLNETAAHLLRAKRYIEEHGWCCDGATDSGNRVCIAEAIGRTAEGWLHSAGWTMGIALGVEPSYGDGHSIGRWNDAPGRTLDEVMGAFDKAISIALTTDG